MFKLSEPVEFGAGSEIEAAIAWLRAFEESRGRPLRVLHVGNVAGNAYLNAKFLRAKGIDCHVLSYDYYHAFGTPEWEDGVTRPDWFVQGPLPESAKYLLALMDGRHFVATLRRQLLATSAPIAGAKTGGSRVARLLRDSTSLVARLRRGARKRRQAIQYRGAYLRSLVWNWYLRQIGLRVTSVLRRTRVLLWRQVGAGRSSTTELPRRAAEPAIGEREALRRAERTAIAAEYRASFPWRTDQLTLDEIEQWQYNLSHWQALVERYDVVQAYGTDVIRPYIAGKRPYVGYEHGTLRDFTMGDDPTHRLTALAYRSADHVFITNGDCLAYADRLGIERRSPMIHPIDVERYCRPLDAAIARLRAELGADILLLCPLRHDWAIKGTDVHLRALPAIRSRNPGQSIVMVLCRWGAQIAQSQQLARDLGCEDSVHWVPPLDRDDLVLYLRSADVVLDQIALPHFGATAPQALAAGTPVIMSYRPESTAWIVGEPAPILPAFEPEGVAEAVQMALDPLWREVFRKLAADWIERHHHPNRIVAEHCRVYRQLLEGGID